MPAIPPVAPTPLADARGVVGWVPAVIPPAPVPRLPSLRPVEWGATAGPAPRAAAPAAEPDPEADQDTTAAPALPGLAPGPAPAAAGGLRAALELRLPPSVRGARVALTRPAVLGLLAVVVLAVVVALGLVLRTAPAAVPVDDGLVAEGPVVLATVPVTVPTASPTARAEVVVDVAGKVREPGVRRLPAGSRVVDALLAAGGALPGTDLSDVAQARLLVDGEQVRVGLGPAPASLEGAGGPAGDGAAASAPPSESAPLDLNAATADQLDGLPGVGPVLAERILAWRTEHGGFTRVEDLKNVSGLGGKKYDALAALVRV